MRGFFGLYIYLGAGYTGFFQFIKIHQADFFLLIFFTYIIFQLKFTKKYRNQEIWNTHERINRCHWFSKFLPF